MSLKVTNNAFGTLNAGISNSDTIIVLEAGQGARFPVLGAGDYFYATLIDTSNNLEIVKVTARATDTMTVVRAQDGTTARAYNVNDRFELRPTAALFNEKADAADVTAELATKQAASPVLTTYVDTGVGMRNRIINGDMRIDQRNNGASVAITDGTTVYTVDRFAIFENSSGALSAQQDSVAPTGFNSSLKITVTTADASIDAADQAFVRQRIEGFNIADLAWGTASAQPVTLSFWVRSSLTGTFGGALNNGATDRSYPFSYTISSANTWEQKTITVAGDTTGTWLTTNGIGLQINWSLAAGSNTAGTAGAWAGSALRGVTGQVQVISTLNATWQITGVQLEAGSVATPFERRPFGTELALCQRYFEKSFNLGVAPANGVSSPDRRQGISYTAVVMAYQEQFRVPKRVDPTLVFYRGSAGPTDNQWAYFNGSTWVAMSTNSTRATQNEFTADFAVSGRATGQAYIIDGNWTASAEL